MQYHAVAALAELLAVLPAEAAAAYRDNDVWLAQLLGAPRPELRYQAAVLHAQVYARSDAATTLAAVTPLIEAAARGYVLTREGQRSKRLRHKGDLVVDSTK